MNRIISPPLDQLAHLRTNLTAGEHQVLKTFCSKLAPEWEIYIQPHLNGLRPDFVLLHPNVGVAVFEVKDWNLNAMQYSSTVREGASPILRAQKNNGPLFPVRSPVTQIKQYKDEIFDIYCPNLNNIQGFAAITAGLIFPCADEEAVINLFAADRKYRGMEKFPKYYPITGRDSVQAMDIEAIFPEGGRSNSIHMNEELAKDLRRWLIEPDFSTTQRLPLELDNVQRALVTTRTHSGFRRIKGPAGSGKSLVVAARAADLAASGKTVLVATFNITLINYLKDLAVRWPNQNGRTRQDVTWINFHALCKRICIENGQEDGYIDLFKKYPKETVLGVELSKLTSTVIDQDSSEDIERYDAILVDEGQDYFPDWWKTLRKLCKRDGEMLLVADTTQDIYGTSSSWTEEAMLNSGFRGRWSELNSCYRLPNDAMAFARLYAESFLPDESSNLPFPPTEGYQIDMLGPCELRWIHTVPDQSVAVCDNEFLRLMRCVGSNNIAIADITFLCASNKQGLFFVEAMESRGVKVVHTFSENEIEARRKKMGFFMGDARVKATTLHSFKGWEARAMVVLVEKAFSPASLALIYAGLTRLKKHQDGSYLTVVCCADELLEFGQKWPDFSEKEAA